MFQLKNSSNKITKQNAMNKWKKRQQSKTNAHRERSRDCATETPKGNITSLGTNDSGDGKKDINYSSYPSRDEEKILSVILIFSFYWFFCVHWSNFTWNSSLQLNVCCCWLVSLHRSIVPGVCPPCICLCALFFLLFLLSFYFPFHSL